MKHLYIDAPLAPNTPLPLERNLHRRLTRVLRFKQGHTFAAFNGRDGLFQVTLTNAEEGLATIGEQLKPQPAKQHTALYLALTKRDAFDRAVRQATEIGIDHIYPVMTDFAVPDKLNTERLNTIIQEAAEQCERLTLPTLHPYQPLAKALENPTGKIFWADETVAKENTLGQWGATATTLQDGLLIGPEGGFSESEKATLATHKNVVRIGLGQYILRVDTAVCVGLGRFFDHLKA